MRRIIDGRIYDTATATELARDGNGAYAGDLDGWDETLYRSPRGQYFIAGTGGAASRYAAPEGVDGRGPGSRIVPLTRAEALAWCERADAVDVAEAEFTDLVERA
jgi:hypothetical protein